MRVLPRAHELKILREHFEDVRKGLKTFELRKNDRGYEAGDDLILKEWDGERFTGREIWAFVTHLIRGPLYGLEEGWVIMSIVSFAERNRRVS